MFFSENVYSVYIASPLKEDKGISNIINDGTNKNRDIDYSQSFFVKNTDNNDNFNVVSSIKSQDSDESWRPQCTISIIDNKYSDDKDKDIETSEKEADKKGGNYLLWSAGNAYDAYYAACHSISALSFLVYKKNERPLMIVATKFMPHSEDLYTVLCFNGFKYKGAKNAQINNLITKNNFKNIIEVKKELQSFLVTMKSEKICK